MGVPEKERTSCLPQYIVGDYVPVFPGDILDIVQDGVSFLFSGRVSEYEAFNIHI